MRIHRMRLEGIGPYADAQDVDMERLNAAGLFLLDGPTGAGKSTILAALCYALYGSVPGGRSPETLVTTLREPGAVVPEVLVEFSVQGRRFEAVRSPRHERPKKRRSAKGGNTTTTQASVSLREFVAGEWGAPLTRADEVGRQIADVMHLDAAQFMQVVMLPQGQFAEFLTAKSEDRQKLLRRLFGTQRFDGVEAHLKERADALQNRVKTDLQVADAARAQLREVAHEELGEDWHAPDPFPQDDESLLSVTAARAAEATEAADAQRGEAAGAEKAAREGLNSLGRTAEALRAAAAWSAREEPHRAAAEDVTADRAAVTEHQRAGHVVSAADRTDEAQAALALAAGATGEAEAAVEEDPLARDWLAEAGAEDAVAPHRAALQRADRAVDALAQAAKDARRITALEKEQRQDEERRTTLTADRAAARTAQKTRAARLEEVRAAVEEGTGRLGAKDAVRARLTEAEERRQAAGRAAACEEEAQRARTVREERAATQRAAAEQRIALLRSRYDQAAAELAEQLEDGEPCAVCGSAEHPRPAPRVGTKVTDADVEDAAAAEEAAKAALAAADEDLAEAQDRVRAARDAAAGLTVEQAEQALAVVQAEQAALTAAQKALAADRRRLATLEKEEAAAAEAETARTAEDARITEATDQRSKRIAELRESVDQARADAPDLEARGALLRAARTRLDALTTAVAAHASAGAVAADAERTLTRALTEQEFTDVAAARAARLAPDDAEARAVRVRAWDAEEARLAELAASESVRRGRGLAAAGTAAPAEEEMLAARERLATAEHAAQEAATLAGRRASLAATVERQSAALRGVFDRSAALLEEYERVAGLLELVRGSGENQLRMPLASYVLAGRLEEIAVAATERLLSMTGGRYSIEYSDDVKGRGRLGLELVIRDHYVDETRHPSTLSGGETFMASLALALGLADTVQAESGGIELDTLFVDEGFGSLDSQTLDDVLDVVDGLRSGGRTVGLVSHVERMKQEIPVRLEVTKDRRGSRLAVHEGH